MYAYTVLCWCAFRDFHILFTVKRLNSNKVVYLRKSRVLPAKLRENLVVKKQVRIENQLVLVIVVVVFFLVFLFLMWFWSRGLQYLWLY